MAKKIDLTPKADSANGNHGQSIFKNAASNKPKNMPSEDGVDKKTETTAKKTRLFIDLEADLFERLGLALIKELQTYDQRLRTPTRASVVKKLFILGLETYEQNK
jgi:hypothetical protein